MKLITKEIMTRLQANAAATRAAQESGKPEPDHKPVLKLFVPWGAGTWLITEIADDGDTLYGLCDLGHGFPELGYVSLAELQGLCGPGGLRIERDKWFRASKMLREYASEANEKMRICA